MPKYRTLRLRRYQKRSSRKCHNKRCVVTKLNGKTQRRYNLRSKRCKKNSRYVGGATTEQIGAAAQMRVELKKLNTTVCIRNTIQLLNDIVHSNERFRNATNMSESNALYDPDYNFNEDSQNGIDAATTFIDKANSSVISPEHKIKLKLARDKADSSRNEYGSVIPQQPMFDFKTYKARTDRSLGRKGNPPIDAQQCQKSGMLDVTAPEFTFSPPQFNYE